MQDAHRDWKSQYDRDRIRLEAARRWLMAIVFFVAGGFFAMAATACLLVLWRLS